MNKGVTLAGEKSIMFNEMGIMFNEMRHYIKKAVNG